MKKNLQSALVFSLSILAFPLGATETLLDIYQQAKQDNPVLKAAEMDYLSTQAVRKQVKSLQKPNASLGANYTQDWNIAADDNSDAQGYQVSVSQSLFNKPNAIQLQQTDNQIQQAQLAFALAQQDFMLRLSSRYMDILMAKADLHFIQGSKQAAQQQWSQAQQRFEVGLITVTDVHEAKARFDQAAADEISIQANVDNAYEALSEETGRVHQGLMLVPEVNLPEDKWLQMPSPNSVEKWTQRAMEYNLQLQIAQLALQNALQGVKRYRSARLPTVDLVAQHAYNEADGRFNDGYSHNNSVSIQLKWLIYSGGGVSAQVEEAHQQHEKSLFNLEKQQRLLKRQVRQAYLNIVSSISQAKALQQALLSSETAYQAIQAEFDVGTRDTVDVLNGKRDFLNAQRNYRKAKYQFLLETLKLKQAAGLLTEEELRLLSDAFQSE